MNTTSAAPVVVGIDGSSAAIDAAIWAVDEALARDVPLRLIHVIPSERGTTPGAGAISLERQYGETALRAASSVVEATDRPVKIETEILCGQPVPVMIEESTHASMLCLGSVGIGFGARKFVGSTAAALAEQAHCPVAVLRAPHQPPAAGADWIVVPVDLTPANADVVEFAMNEAHLRHAPVLAVGVWCADFGATPYDELDQRVGEWTQRHPDVHVYPVATKARLAAFLAENHEESVQLAVFGADAAGQVAQIVGPRRHPLIPHGRCSVLIVR